MKIWLINQYNMPPEYGPFNRHYNLAKYLTKLGHNPVVFVGSYLHNTNIQIINDRTLYKKYDDPDLSFYFIRTINYASSKLKRVFGMVEFYKNVLKTALDFEKPDVILGSSAHPLSALAAIKLGKKYNCQSIVEIRDLWPESFTAYGIMGRNNPLLKLLYAGEKWLYTHADKVIFTMEGGRDYIIDRKWDKESGGPIDLKKVFHLNNGVDLDAFEVNKLKHQFQDKDLDDGNTFKVIYVGSIRLVNNVKQIVDAAHELKKKGVDDVKFIIYGEGNDRETLMKYCKDHNIDNVVFKGFVEKKYIPYVLSQSNLNIIHFVQNDIKKYGASLNKMFDYFASGKPTLSDCEFGYDIIKRHGCGVTVDNADASQLAEEVIKFRDMDAGTYDHYCANAIETAKMYDFKNLANKLVEIIGE